ncbi:DUF898 family protein [Aestuariispira insulae]|uniref:Uncharacterized membrane protein YjgN (DUF898 family) n=1 Tax=Aestuariispira insulae TaxID=1461337 RepID=A0A3D9HP15_9PROT|nr:DUF898 family protein [Aestuariispira insulae]RED51230.1 uncharacterized membrane protein YjgN (DUF898 family) [Aestuariispira insulae]
MALTYDERVLAGRPQHSGNRSDSGNGGRFSAMVSGGTLFGMLLKYALLTFLTLGIYRFWAKTGLRRHLWGRVLYGGDPFQYHGTAKELFVGFLIALAVLLPLGIIHLLISRWIGAADLSGASSLINSAVYFLVLFGLVSLAFYRMRRYQLSRTSWRSVHFSLAGSPVEYAAKSLLWGMATLASLGLAYPWMLAWQNRQILNNARLGQARFSCRVRGVDILVRYILFYGLLLLLGLIYTALLASLSSGREPAAATGPVVFLLFLVIPVAFIAFRLSVFKLVASETRLNKHRIYARFQTGKVVLSGFIATLTGGLVFLVTLAGVMAIGLLFTVGMISLDGIANAEGVIFVLLNMMQWLLPAGILATMLATAAAKSIFLSSLLETVIPGLKIAQSERLEAILAGNQSAPRYGEGLADALDVGSF